MTEVVETPENLALSAELAENNLDGEHAKTVFLLGVVAAFEVAGFTSAMVNSLPDGVSPFLASLANSSAHPLLGYTGVWAAEKLGRQSGYHLPAKIGVLAAIAVNFAGEAAQSLLISSGEFRNFLAPRNMPETLKDCVFALGGAALFYLHRKRIHQRALLPEPAEARD